MRAVFRFLIFFVLLFLIPVAGSAAWWSTVERPGSWRDANWNSSGLLAGNPDQGQAAIYVMAARTGGFKGAFAVHSWLLIKRKDQNGYDRYDKLGWGKPVRKDAYAADANWYSNAPYVVAKINGSKAETLIPKVERAIADYRYSSRGDYHIWPGPNSNTFVASVLRDVPSLGAVLPPNAVGRDYLGENEWFMREADGSDTHISFRGLIGVSFGKKTGFELHFMGQTIGFDWRHPALKLPAFGRVELSTAA